MEVIRDSCWYALLMQTIKFYNVIEPDERCVRLADAEWRLKQRHEAIRKAKAQRGIIVIDPVIEEPREKRNSHKICAATTMAGKRCSYRAVCGDFCRKHKVPTEDIDGLANMMKGIKIDNKSVSDGSVDDLCTMLGEIKINA